MLHIPVNECHEPLVDLRTLDTLRLDPRLADAAGAYAHLRVSLADRLVTAQALLPRHLRLLIVEGYRPPDRELAWLEPHMAGAAVDLTLSTPDGVELWLGTEVNDTNTQACPAEAVGLRLVLSEALSAVGLVNYPTEWWHWSYGDRYWAYVSGRAEARYGPVATLPS